MKKAAASVIIGLFLWLVLMFIHEEWEQYYTGGLAGPPPFNPFNMVVPITLILGVWALLVVFIRWAERQLDGPVPRRR